MSSNRKIFVVSGVLSYGNGDLYQDNTHAFSHRCDADAYLARVVADMAARGAYVVGDDDGRASDFNVFMRDGQGGRFGWNVDEIALEDEYVEVEE